MHSQSNSPTPALPAVAVLLGLAGCALFVDVAWTRWLLDGHIPKTLAKLCALSEVFAHGLGVALIATVIFVLDPRRRVALPRVLTAAYGAGICANLIKLAVARTRPHDFDFSGAASSFVGWIPLGRGGSGVQSFPSSHAATAVGLALALAWLYPRGRRLFAGLAILACGQRLIAGAHFLSDVLVGCGVGWAFAAQCVGAGRCSRLFDRWEAALSRRRAVDAGQHPGGAPATLAIRPPESGGDQSVAAAG